jgi:imidazolonepropionase-like amidohydrolase
MFDLIIRGGDVVTPEGVARCDVAVAGETIAAIATPGSLPADSAKQLIDATGRIVMPGGIDPHVHLHHRERGAQWSTAEHYTSRFLDIFQHVPYCGGARGNIQEQAILLPPKLGVTPWPKN